MMIPTRVRPIGSTAVKLLGRNRLAFAKAKGKTTSRQIIIKRQHKLRAVFFLFSISIV